MKIGKEPSPSGQDVDTSSKEEKEKKIEEKQESSKSSKRVQEQESSSSSSPGEASSTRENESSDDEEEEDGDDQASCSSSDDSEEIKQLVKGVNKLPKKLNSKGVPTTIEQFVSYNQRKKNKKKEYIGCGEKGHYIEYCPLMKTRHKEKKKERKASKKAFTSIAKGGFDMTSSSDEEIHHKPCTFLSLSSSSHICLMAKGMNDSDVSDDDSCPSIHELVDLVRTQEVAITRLLSKNKELKGKLASSSSNYKELAEKIDMIIDQNNELTKKIELLEQTITIYKKASKSIIETKKDASTSCIDLIDESSSLSCNEICVENVVVETCDDLIAQENNKLKQEVTRLTKGLDKAKEKEKLS
jgi:hypothetical protein